MSFPVLDGPLASRAMMYILSDRTLACPVPSLSYPVRCGSVLTGHVLFFLFLACLALFNPVLSRPVLF